MAQEFRVFSAEAHQILQRIAAREIANPTPWESMATRDPKEYSVRKAGTLVWARIAASITAATFGDPEDTSDVSPVKPHTRNPYLRTCGLAKTLKKPTDSDPETRAGWGLADLHVYSDEGVEEVLNHPRVKVFNQAFHPVPIGWVVPLMSIDGRYWVADISPGWLLKTKTGGIPASDGDAAGSGWCEIWQTSPRKARYRVEEGGNPLLIEVLNWHPETEIDSDRFIQAKTIDGWATIDVDYC